DPQFDDQFQSGLYYQVIGWYSDPDPKNDWIHSLFLMRELPETSFSSFLKDQLRFSVAGDLTPNFVMACHGSLIFCHKPDSELAVKLDKPAIAFGATMTEALSAYLASEVVKADDPTKTAEQNAAEKAAKTAADRAAEKTMIEDKFEAIMLDRKLSTRTVDLT